MTNNVRDTDDGRVWGSSHCLLRKERIWRGGSKIFLPNIFVNIFASSNFTHISTLFFCKILSQSIFSRIFPTNIFFTFEPASTSTGYWFIIANTKFLTLFLTKLSWEAVFGLMRHLCCTLENELLAEFVFVFVLLFVFVFIPLIRQVCCSPVGGLQSISWWVVGGGGRCPQREVDDDPPANWRNHRTIALSHRSHSTTLAEYHLSKKGFWGLSALAIEKQHCTIPNSLKYLTFVTAK